MIKKIALIVSILSVLNIAAFALPKDSLSSLESQTVYFVSSPVSAYDMKYLQPSDELFDYPIYAAEIQEIVSKINKSQSDYQTVKEIERFVQDYLEPTEEETYTDVLDSLRAGNGDCDDYALLFVTITRASGIPARPAFNSKHMWAEVLLPFEDGYRWVVVDPTGQYEEVVLGS